MSQRIDHQDLIDLGFETFEKQNHSYYQLRCYEDHGRWHCLGIYATQLESGVFSIDTFFKTQPIKDRESLEVLIRLLKPE